jgi:hypothetical protein
MLPSSLSLGTDIFLQELDSADALERFQILTVPFFFSNFVVLYVLSWTCCDADRFVPLCRRAHRHLETVPI